MHVQAMQPQTESKRETVNPGVPPVPQAFETRTGGIVQRPSSYSNIRDRYRVSAMSARAEHGGCNHAVDNQQCCHETYPSCLPRVLRCERPLSLQGVLFTAVEDRIV